MTKKHARSRSKRKDKSTRRARTRTRTRTRRRSCVKKGGMFRSLARGPRNMASLFINHNVLPLIREYEYRVGALNPKPTDGVVTPDRLKYFNSFEDIPVDDGIKRSIEELKKEVNNPVKNLDKIVTAYKNATETTKKIEDDKRKTKPDTQPPSSQFIQMISPYMLRNSVLPSTTSLVDSPRNETPQTPNTNLNRDYSTDINTSIKPPSKGVLRRNDRGGDGDDDDDDVTDADDGEHTNLPKVLFRDDDIQTPPQSQVPMSPSPKKNSTVRRRLVL